jgi:hypothetical protein
VSQLLKRLRQENRLNLGVQSQRGQHSVTLSHKKQQRRAWGHGSVVECMQSTIELHPQAPKDDF